MPVEINNYVMKMLLLILFLFCLKSTSAQVASNKEINISCTISATAKIYKVGTLPLIQVEIVNNTSEDIYLIGALDGSGTKRRMPYCYFTIEKPRPDTIIYQGCGFSNPLRIEECRLVKSGGTFNPYTQIDSLGYWTDNTINRKETFRNAGLYKIQFHYSTNSEDIHSFLGSWDMNPEIPKLKKLIEKVPKLELASNIIEIEIVE